MLDRTLNHTRRTSESDKKLLKDWDGEPSIFDPFIEECRPSKLQWSWMVHIPLNRETMEYEKLCRKLAAAMREKPRDFNKVYGLREELNKFLVAIGERPVAFQPLRRTLTEFIRELIKKS